MSSESAEARIGFSNRGGGNWVGRRNGITRITQIPFTIGRF
jgi:hypothetical protein